jgi:hypothetical protein
MRPNKQLLILEDQIFTDKKYTQKVKLKRNTTYFSEFFL